VVVADARRVVRWLRGRLLSALEAVLRNGSFLQGTGVVVSARIRHGQT
jgi:hypothetical protein